MSNLFAYFLTPSLAINGPILLVAAVALTVALRSQLGTRGRRILFLASALACGVILQATLLREPPIGPCWTCLTQWSPTRLLGGQVGLETALNIALFAPLGLFATLLSKRPWRVTGTAALLSIAIECIQPLLGIGANDLADLAANTLGALIGSGIAVTIAVVRDAIASRRLDLPRAGRLAATVALAVGALLGVSIGGANAIQTASTQELNGTFAGTTLADYQRDQGALASKLQTFWETNRTPTTDAYSDHQIALHRFAWTYYWTTRCVTARWDSLGFATESGSGDQCSQPLH